MFVGRSEELKTLKKFYGRKSASMILVQGRRRIGKSTLIRESAKSSKLPLHEIQGLPPREGQTNQDQINHFVNELKLIFGKKLKHPEPISNWSSAFRLLAEISKKGSCVIFLDEISWMGTHDPDFSGTLKTIWDQEFSKIPHLVFFICGSVSTWIEKNIARNTGYVGRISMTLKLTELPLQHCYEFFENSRYTPFEVIKILSLVGGVPRYLEEFIPEDSLNANIIRLFFQPTGFLFNEFEQIFSDIFGKRHSNYKKILNTLLNERLSPVDIAEKLDLPLNSDFSDAIADLELGGFINRDFNWNFTSNELAKLSQLRISDNYSRFYLRYVKPKKSRFEKIKLRTSDPLNFIPWESLLGLQFENLVLNNLDYILEQLEIHRTDVVHIGPYFQRKNLKQKGVQIDLLIQSKHNVLFLGEVKCQNKISGDVVHSVSEKMTALKRPKGFAIRPFLVYAGELSSGLKESTFFTKNINFEEALNPDSAHRTN